MWLDNLKAMKSASKMTTKEIAIKSGIPEPTLEKLFAGVTKDPKLDTVRSVVDVLGYTLDDLVSGFRSGNSKKPAPSELTTDEQELLTGYRELSQQGKEYILQTVAMATRVYIKPDCASNMENQTG